MSAWRIARVMGQMAFALVLLSTNASAQTAGVNERERFIDHSISGCVTNMLQRSPDASDARVANFKTYCTCVANGVAAQLTADELHDFVTSGLTPQAAAPAMDRAASACANSKR